MGVKPVLLLLLFLCGLSVSERLLPPQHLKVQPPAYVQFPPPSLLKPLPPGPQKLVSGDMVPVSNVQVSGVSKLENYNNSVVETCTAEGTSPTFKWFNGSTEITGDGHRIHVAQTENTGTLTISPIYRFDLATLTFCEASNAISKAHSSKFNLVLSITDDMTIFPEAPPVYVASQSDFSLMCSTSSEPVTNIRWYLDGAQLETSGPTLTVKDIEKEGLGSTRSLYTCNATGLTTGKNRPSMPVVFTIIDSISGVMLNSSVIKNVSANLNCSVTTGSMQTFTWLKDGVALNSDGRVVIAADMRSVQINPLQKKDNGEYTCEVSNPVSTQSARTTLAIYFSAEPQSLSRTSERGAIAGIVIGVLAGIGLAVGLIVFWQKKLRHYTGNQAADIL